MKTIGWGIIILLLLLPSYVMAGEPWDDTDKALFALDLAVTFLDYKQTIQIAEQEPRTEWSIYELNPIMGKHPTKNRVTLHFLGAVITQYLIADYLKPKQRKIFLITMFLFESIVVKHNLNMGVKF